MSGPFPSLTPPATPDRADAAAVPDARNHCGNWQHPIHCTMHAIELETLVGHHTALAADLHHRGEGEAADLMEARAAELRRVAERARAGR